jgi:hypothetical protein
MRRSTLLTKSLSESLRKCCPLSLSPVSTVIRLECHDPYKIRTIAVVRKRTGFPSDDIVEVRAEAIVAFPWSYGSPTCVVECQLPRLGVGALPRRPLGHSRELQKNLKSTARPTAPKFGRSKSKRAASARHRRPCRRDRKRHGGRNDAYFAIHALLLYVVRRCSAFPGSSALASRAPTVGCGWPNTLHGELETNSLDH